MIILKIIITLFLLFAILTLIKQFKKSQIALAGFLFWLIVWITVGIVFWQPELTTRLANQFGIGRGSDFIIYISIIVIFYQLFRIYAHIEKIETNITKIIRKIAIDNAQDNRKLDKNN
ncbi:MAG: DUF2304 family protein [Patescibacteria group bacterium]|nr:DUF2304 family protein [Patescibacteria group bacterium]